MDRHTVVNFGAIIVTGIIISVLIALATPFGNMIGEALVSSITHEKQWTDTKLEENLSDKTGKDMDALFDTTEALAPGLYPHGSSFATLTEEELIKTAHCFAKDYKKLLEKAKEWWEKALKNGNDNAKSRLEKIYE